MTYSDTEPLLGIGPRVRKSPFFEATLRAGVKAFSIYNHMYLPLYFTDWETEYWSLINDVTLWDVGVQRQVELRGPDAFRLVQRLTPRNLSKFAIGQGKYVLIVNDEGGILNDPVLLRLADDCFWLSIADRDILLWVRGIAVAAGLDVKVTEPDASPLALQGPKADAVMRDLFGEWPAALRYFWFRETELDGIPLLVARSGWSKQGGFELYLLDRNSGSALWERMMEAGKPYNIAPGAPSSVERIESGLLSYGSDMDDTTNPFEVGLGKIVDLDQPVEFIGKRALQRIQSEGVKRKHVGLEIDGDRLPGNEQHWPLSVNGEPAGVVTSTIFSLRLQKNIALALVPIEHGATGTSLMVQTSAGERKATVTSLPHIPPRM